MFELFVFLVFLDVRTFVIFAIKSLSAIGFCSYIISESPAHYTFSHFCTVLIFKLKLISFIHLSVNEIRDIAAVAV